MFWRRVVNTKDVDKYMLDNLKKEKFDRISVTYPSISEREFELIKDGNIILTNAKTQSANDFDHFTWKELLDHFPEEAFYI